MKLHVKSASFLSDNGQTSSFSFFQLLISNDKNFIPKYLDNAPTDSVLTSRTSRRLLEEKAPVNDFRRIVSNGVISLLWQLRCHCNPDHDKFSSLPNTTVVAIFPNVGLERRSVYAQTWPGRYWPWKTVFSHFHMPIRPTLLQCMALVSFRLFCKNLGNLQEFFGKMVYRPSWKKIARTPMLWGAFNVLKCFVIFKKLLVSLLIC